LCNRTLIIIHGSKDFFLIESEQKIIDTRNQDLNTLIKILLVKLYEVVFSDAEIV
ncbi:GntR family transcriptional regulator, partial [Enterococcus faecium]